MAAVGADESKDSTRGGFDAGTKLPPCTNSLVTPLLTDMYQISMTYAYWRAGRHDDEACFDLFFRKNPFKGEYTILAGVEEVLRLVDNFKFSDGEIEFLRSTLPDAEDEFFEYLAALDCSSLLVYTIPEATVVFPRVPLIKLVGPLAVCQLLETTILCLCNYASLMCTNASRFRHAAGADKVLLEFGLRRAQGPDGAMSASRYSYIGGFDGTSNCAAGHVFGLTPKGTHAHSFVSSYTGLDMLSTTKLRSKDGEREVDFVEAVMAYRKKLSPASNMGELAAFIGYAQAFPDGFLALVDTYDTLNSGVPNFIAVALALNDLGYTPRGIRLDSGDLAYLSREARKAFVRASEQFDFDLSTQTIVASNDINEAVLYSLDSQGHEINAFGIGTNLVTCQAQPALGMVYKLVEVNKTPRIKLSQEITKVTIPGNKQAYRLVSRDGTPLLDVLVQANETAPTPGSRMLCRHPFEEKKRVYVTPTTVVPLLELAWVGAARCKDAAKELGREVTPGLQVRLLSLGELKERTKAQLASLRPDHLRHMNPSPYKVSVSPSLYTFIHDLWMREAPISELT